MRSKGQAVRAGTAMAIPTGPAVSHRPHLGDVLLRCSRVPADETTTRRPGTAQRAGWCLTPAFSETRPRFLCSLTGSTLRREGNAAALGKERHAKCVFRSHLLSRQHTSFPRSLPFTENGTESSEFHTLPSRALPSFPSLTPCTGKAQWLHLMNQCSYIIS